MLQDFLDQLVADWFGLLAYTQSQEFDRKQFRAKHDAWAKSWGRMKWADQGYVTEQISHRLKG